MLFLIMSLFTLTSMQASISVNNVCDRKYDYIVVGAGTSGCVLAEQLSRCKHKSVLLIDGGLDYQDAWDIEYNDQLNFDAQTLRSRALEVNYAGYWNINTLKPSDENFLEKYVYAQVLGGLTAVNDQVYERGAEKTWNYIGSQVPGFDWKSVLPFFKAIETADLTQSVASAGNTRGTCGPMIVKNKPFVGQNNPLNALMQDISKAMGVTVGKDYNDGNQVGLFEAQYNVTEFSDLTNNGAPTIALLHPEFVYGKRETSFERFIVKTGAINRCNLTVLTSQRVQKLKVEKCKGVNRASGVVIFNGSALITILGEKIVLAAGALNTPLILQQSGIGNKEDLDTAGISQCVDIPGIGRNLHDHLWVGTVGFNDKTVYPPNYLPPQIILFADSGVNPTEPIGTPDLEFIFLPNIISPGTVQWWVDVYVTRHSIRGNTITDAPGLQPQYPNPPFLPWQTGVSTNFYQNPSPLAIQDTLIAVYKKFLLPLFSNSTLLTYNPSLNVSTARANIALNSNMITNESLIIADLKKVSSGTTIAALNATGLCRWSSNRYGGTCALGNVVDQNFKVDKFSNLFVCDSSALPVPVQSHMDAPMMMFGKKLGYFLTKKQ